jgi:hypothetical protein
MKNMLERFKMVWSFVKTGDIDSLDANKSHKIALMILEVRKYEKSAFEKELHYLKVENNRLENDNSNLKAILSWKRF